jgi:hypothetical protein
MASLYVTLGAPSFKEVLSRRFSLQLHDSPTLTHTMAAPSLVPSGFSSQNAKIAQLEEHTVRPEKGGGFHNTIFGAKYDNTDNWLRAGARGPSSLEDPIGREKIQHCT